MAGTPAGVAFEVNQLTQRVLSEALRSTNRGVAQAANTFSAQAVQSASAQTSVQMSEYLFAFAETLRNNAVGQGAAGAQRRELNTRIAKKAAGAMQERYYAKKIGRYVDPPGLERSPRNRRYSNGAMLQALRDPRHYENADKDITGFFSTEAMEFHAKQWYRLNFGALPRGKGTQREFAVKFFGETTAFVSYKGRPSAGFSVPPGIWGADPLNEADNFAPRRRTLINRGEAGISQGAFSSRNRAAVTGFTPLGDVPLNLQYIKGSAARGEDKFVRNPNITPGFRTQGIREMNYIDAGLSTLSREWSRGYTALVQDWFRRASASGDGALVEAGAVPAVTTGRGGLAREGARVVTRTINDLQLQTRGYQRLLSDIRRRAAL